MTRKEAREIAFAIVFESSFHSEGLDYILENAAEGRDLSLPDGSFAKEFLLDMSGAGRQVHFKAMRKLATEHPSEKVGAEIRKLYSWNNEEDKLINN